MDCVGKLEASLRCHAVEAACICVYAWVPVPCVRERYTAVFSIAFLARSSMKRCNPEGHCKVVTAANGDLIGVSKFKFRLVMTKASARASLAD